MANLSQGRGSWAEGKLRARTVHCRRDKLVVYVYVRVRLRDNTDWIEARLADVYTFRNGKAIQMRHFPDRRQALEWAEECCRRHGGDDDGQQGT